MSSDPRDIINTSPMGALQAFIIATMVALNALDGFDILSISFASPGIAKEWGVDKTTLGALLSMELVGMGFGSFFLGGLADKIGRRPTALYCLCVMALGMFMVTASGSILGLACWRVFTGIGIGGLLTAITSLSVEFSNTSRRHLSVSIMAIGYPLGGIVGGSIASRLLVNYDWRSVFYLGASITALLIPVVYFFIPESVHWLARKQPAGALKRINSTLRKCDKPAVAALPNITDSVRRQSIGEIFSPRFLKTTVIIAISYVLHITTYYFILKWVPKIVADMGFAVSSASNVLVWANVGGAIGGIVFGFLTFKFDLKKLSVFILFFAGVTIAVFGHTPADLTTMSMLCMLAGFFGNSAIIALYAVVANAYPTHARSFGTGFMLAFGRGGAVLSPILVGFLLDMEIPLPSVGMIMSIGSLVAAFVLLFLKVQSGDAADAEDALKKSKAESSAA